MELVKFTDDTYLSLSNDKGGGGWTNFFFVVLKIFVFASLCSFVCLQAVYQLSGPEY